MSIFNETPKVHQGRSAVAIFMDDLLCPTVQLLPSTESNSFRSGGGMRNRISVERCDLKWAQNLVAEKHYLHRPIHARSLPFAYAIKLDGEVVGTIIMATVHFTKQKDLFGYEGLPTKWQVLQVARLWLDPKVQGRQENGHASCIASCALAKMLKRVNQDWLEYHPPKFPEEPYNIELILAYADTGVGHDGTIYKASNFARWGVTTNNRVRRTNRGSSTESEKILYVYKLSKIQRLEVVDISAIKSSSGNKQSDKWYTPPHIIDLITQVLGKIDLDPCADDGKHIPAGVHYTAVDDGLSKPWHGRVFFNPPYSCPREWVAKLQAEVKAGRVSEAVALLPAATDTNWFSPLLATQPVCFWKGRIKFLDANYQPKLPARQSHALIYWGKNPQRFKEVFQQFGVVMDASSWNPAHFGDMPYKTEGNQLTIFYDDNHEPPDPDDYSTIIDYEKAWQKWELSNQQSTTKDKVMTFQFSETARISEQIAQLQEQLNKLTDSLKPYQEYEQKADELLSDVATHTYLMREKGIHQNELCQWAELLYSAASGAELRLADTSVIDTQNEQIAQFKNAFSIAQKHEELAIAQRDEAILAARKIQDENASLVAKIQKLEELTDSQNEELAELQLISEVEALRQEIEELKVSNEKLQYERNQLKKHLQQKAEVEESNILTSQKAYTKILSAGDIVEVPATWLGEVTIEASDLLGTVIEFISDFIVVKLSDGKLFKYKRDELKWISSIREEAGLHNFQEGDRVEVVNFEDEDLINKQGTVVWENGNYVAVLFDATDDQAQHETVIPASCLKLIEKKHSDTIAEIRGREFIASVRLKGEMSNITWQNVREVCLGNPFALREIKLSATKKYQKQLIEKLPQLLADYISETGDITDFTWVDNTFKLKVKEILKAND